MSEHFKIVIHGGAGVIPPNKKDIEQYIFALKQILTTVYIHTVENLNELSTMDIVEFAVQCLENESLFNAGVGSVYTNSETHELEASIMDGQSLKCGSVSMVTTIEHPISLARIIMEKTPHNYIVGTSAEELGVKFGLKQVPSTYFSTKNRLDQLIEAKKSDQVCNDHDLEKSSGTVGCVCYFKNNVSAGTSTGGMTNKISGRIGDSPIIGAGTYANNKTCAVSATGKGEEFMRHLAAYDISCRMEYLQLSLDEAVKQTVWNRLPLESGGVIAIDMNFAFHHNKNEDLLHKYYMAAKYKS